MYMVVILHVLGNGGVLRNLEVLSIGYKLAWLLEISCYCAVNCYALITGYVMVDSKFSYKKIFYLWVDVLFWRLFLTILLNYIYPDLVGKRDLLKSILNITYNSYWYFTAYFALFFFIPYINKLINVLDKKLFKRLVITMIGLFSIINLVFGTFALSGGYCFTWLMVLYFIGAYIKRYNVSKKVNKLYIVIGMFFSMLLTFVSKMFFIKFPSFTFELFGDGVLVNYTSITILFVAIGLVLLFSNFNIKNKYFRRFIKRVAPATFGVYIIHEHSIVKKIFMTNGFSFIAFNDWYLIVLLVLGIAAIIFMICAYMEMFRKYLFKKLKIYYIGDFLYTIVKRFINKIESFDKEVINDEDISYIGNSR